MLVRGIGIAGWCGGSAWVGVLAALALAVAAAACGAGAAAGREGGGLEVMADGTARVVGVVVDNERGCEVDGVCRLVLDAGGRRVIVIYHGGEGERCVNREAVRRGLAAKPAERIEAYGSYSEAGPTVSTCASERYYLRSAAAE